MGSARTGLTSALVPVGAMLGTQIMISLAVLSLSVQMPAVARDLAIDPKFVGAFTAMTYAVVSFVALGSAGPISRLGAVRVCQFAMIAAAAGLALNAVATIAATVVAAILIGFAQGTYGQSIGPANAPSPHLAMIVAQKPTQSLAAANRPLAAAARVPRKQQDVALPLMIPLGMDMIDVFAQRPPQGALAEQDHLRQALLLDRSDPALRVGIQVRAACRQRQRLNPT